MKKKVILATSIALVVVALLWYMAFVKFDFGKSNKDSFLEFLKPIDNKVEYILNNKANLFNKSGNVKANFSIKASAEKIILTSIKEDIDASYDFNQDKFFMTNEQSKLLFDLKEDNMYLNKSGDSITYTANVEDTDNRFVSVIRLLSNMSKNLSSKTYDKIVVILKNNLKEEYFSSNKNLISNNTYVFAANKNNISKFIEAVIRDVKNDSELLNTISIAYNSLVQEHKIPFEEWLDNQLANLNKYDTISVNVTIEAGRAIPSEISRIVANLEINGDEFECIINGQDKKTIKTSNMISYVLKKNNETIKEFSAESADKKALVLSKSISVNSFNSGDISKERMLKSNDDKPMYSTTNLSYLSDISNESGELFNIKSNDRKYLLNTSSITIVAEEGLPEKLNGSIVANDNIRLLNTKDITMHFNIASNTLEFKKNKDGMSFNTTFIIAKKQKILVIETILKNEIKFGFELNYTDSIDFDKLFEIKENKQVEFEELLKKI